MTETAYVEQAAQWANFLTKTESRGPGDLPNAWQRLEYKYGIPSAVFWSLRYRKPRGILTGLYTALKAAHDQEKQRQYRLLQHELQTARLLGAAVEDLDPSLTPLVADEGDT